jgi:hypothetical protein
MGMVNATLDESADREDDCDSIDLPWHSEKEVLMLCLRDSARRVCVAALHGSEDDDDNGVIPRVG